ncbi:hypothetical protein OPT61_g2783 [Boeremia exigua]|uniref:Uncharacterized protein n=1 Tax=Boeremia exigua TaxID=749465 RepID=A0ACC2IK92_9PLEO|nr:hypothetical protein OPT61_g2783 [Boeremia exigua]
MSERSRDKADPPPRKRALVSCDRCKIRRARCIRDSPDEPCADCKMSGVSCESKLPRKQRVYGSVETLSLRYRALESLVKGLFPQDNVQDVNVLFKLATERNIPMPANDDFRPADIFSSPSQSRMSQSSQQHMSTHHSTQSMISPQTAESSRSTTTTSPMSTTRESQHNPFSEVQPARHNHEELIPTRHGVPHYFGPSSSFRLAMTIRMLRVQPFLTTDQHKPFGRRVHDRLLGQQGVDDSRSQRPQALENANGDDRRLVAIPEHAHTRDYWGLAALSVTCRSAGVCLLRSYTRLSPIVPQEHVSISSRSHVLEEFGLASGLYRHMLAYVFVLGLLIWLPAAAGARPGAVTQATHKIPRLRQIQLPAPLYDDFNSQRPGFGSPQRASSHHRPEEQLLAADWTGCTHGRPTVIDDREMSMKIPDTPLLEQRSMSAEFMTYGFEIIKLSYTIRQRAYFDSNTAEERSPSLAMAESLMRECNAFIQTIPPDLSLTWLPTTPPEQKARILLLHVYYYYTRCIVSRDFLVKKIESNIAYAEERAMPYSDEHTRTLALSEDCVESAHQSLRCILEGADLGIIGNSWLDLFFVFHSVLIVCADFLARPRDQPNTAKDSERKETVRAMLNHIRGMKLAATYKILSRIATQFANITGVAEGYESTGETSSSQGAGMRVDMHQASLGRDEASHNLAEVLNIQEDWFANATSSLGLDFFDLQQSPETLPLQAEHSAYPELYGAQPNANEVDDWTARTLRGMHTL